MNYQEQALQIYEKVKEKQILGLHLIEDEGLFIKFSNCSYKIFDNAQACCEKRYMTCDDNLKDFIGSIIFQVECLEYFSKKTEEEWERTHDGMFLRICTDRGDFRLCMHNVHNGWYGGFDPEIESWSFPKQANISNEIMKK